MLSWPIYWCLQGALSAVSVVLLCLIVRNLLRLRGLELQIRKNNLGHGNEAQSGGQPKEIKWRVCARLTSRHDIYDLFYAKDRGDAVAQAKTKYPEALIIGARQE
jgi:hypothetical protein